MTTEDVRDRTVADQATPPEAGPLWRRIADDLAAAIAAGGYASGAALPTALSLAERYGVHRHTARQALLHLQHRGLVSVERGRGSFVTQPHLPYPIGRRVSFRANAGAAGVNAAGSVRSLPSTPAEDGVALALGLDPGTELWRIETFARLDGVPLSTATHYLEKARFPAFDRHLAAGSASITRALAASGVPDYIRLSTALTARPASAAEAALLDVLPGAALMVSRGLDGTPDGRPLHLVVALFVAERVEFLIEPQEMAAASQAG
jgi:GntR family phosphonate transport system transcriptional regulator